MGDGDGSAQDSPFSFSSTELGLDVSLTKYGHLVSTFLSQSMGNLLQNATGLTVCNLTRQKSYTQRLDPKPFRN